MLENSFIHLPTITAETEARLWSQGCRTWDDLEVSLPGMFGAKKVQKLLQSLDDSRVAYEACELGYFQERLKATEMWRILPALIDQGLASKIAYLDIETTGLGSPPRCQSTTVAVLFDGELHLEHEPIKKQRLLEKLEKEAQCFVTFNGVTFDLPFLRKEFQVRLDQAHVDLRYWFAKLDRRGGLKKIQQTFAEVRQRESMDIDGFDAVKLWRMHEWGVERALESLLTYNAEDTVVLEQLMYCGLNLEAEAKAHLGLATYQVPMCPEIPTRVCTEVYRQLRGQAW